jgi:hypothetical protein
MQIGMLRAAGVAHPRASDGKWTRCGRAIGRLTHSETINRDGMQGARSAHDVTFDAALLKQAGAQIAWPGRRDR